MWDPVAKKWVDKPAGTAGLVSGAYAGLPMSIEPEAAVGYNEYVSDYGTSGSLEDILGKTGGAGGGPSRQQSSRWGSQAARGLERAGRRSAAAVRSRADEQAAAMRGLYDPMYAQQEAAVRGLRGQSEAAYNPYFTQQEAGIEAQRKAAMDYLDAQYGGNQQAIQQATQAALAAIPQAQAYSNVPLLELSPQQNPLLASLQGFGASTEAAGVQSAQDAALAAQMAQLVRGSAGQLNTAQQAMRQAALGDINAGQALALQQLALGRMGAQAGISGAAQQGLTGLAGERARLGADLASAEASGLVDLAKQRAGSGVEVEQMRQEMLNKALEQMLGGRDAAAQLRAKTIAEFGPSGKKKTGKGKGKGKK
jgi:hypothetical protein